MSKAQPNTVIRNLGRFSRASDDYVCTLETECQCSPRMRPQCEFALPRYPDRAAADRRAEARPRPEPPPTSVRPTGDGAKPLARDVVETGHLAILVLLGIAAAAVVVLLLLY